MEIDKDVFYNNLLAILTDISESFFVAFDLELSGVPSKQFRHGAGKPSLQARYLETKEAAERYQILQIGLTCVQQDPEGEKYILKPYNFDLNPLIAEPGLDIERIFSFQSGAIEFLLRSNFDIARPFRSGVPYLSRAESRAARQKNNKRGQQNGIADLQIKPTEVDTLAFVERVRKQIKSWLQSSSSDFINIGASASQDINEDENPQEELTRYQKRLVHQVVHADFPELITIGKNAFVQVLRFDQEREDRVAETRKRELNERIGRQKGFRWIIEALLGKDITDLDLRECAKDPATGSVPTGRIDVLRSQLARTQDFIRNKPRMLVGHNCFLDLVYIYRTFIGNLPDTVEEFQAKIHKLWPVIVDTKYVSTRDCGDINPVSSLQQIARQLGSQEKPSLAVHEKHTKYIGLEAFHEAGYDSFLTAQVGIQLSSIFAEGVDQYAQQRHGALAPTGPKVGESGEENSSPILNAHKTRKRVDGTPGDAGTPFTPSVEDSDWARNGDSSLPAPSESDPFVQARNKSLVMPVRLKRNIRGGMPPLGSAFWRIIGNRLRVFGTEESVCVLGPDKLDDLDAGSKSGGGVALNS